VPSAAGISNFARITAGSFAASLIETFWDRRETLHQSHLVESATRFSPVYIKTLETLQQKGMTPLQGAGSVMQELINQAYLLSSLDLFWICGWISLAMVAVVWLARRPAPSAHVVAAD